VIDQILRFTLPAAYALLPPEMASAEATAMLLAIGLQESRFQYRRQIGGPAHGFWQFELGGLSGVLTHHATATPLAQVLQVLHYEPTYVFPALADNDVLAACVARCLLWTDPRDLPGPNDTTQAWDLYQGLWRPGRPHRATWDANFAEGWQRTIGARALSQELKA
jgi:hypothetical protein